MNRMGGRGRFRRAMRCLGLGMACLTAISCSNRKGLAAEKVDGGRSFSSPDAVYDALVAACKAKDGAAIWEMSLPHFREQMETEAKRWARQDAKLLEAAYPAYQGAPRDFDGRALLLAAVQLDDAARNPCADAAQWKKGARSIADPQQKGGWLMAAERPGNLAFGIRMFEASKGKWMLYEIMKSQSIPPPRPQRCNVTGKLTFNLTWDKTKNWHEDFFKKNCLLDRLPRTIQTTVTSIPPQGMPVFGHTKHVPTSTFLNYGECEFVYDGIKAGMLNDDILLKVTFNQKERKLVGSAKYEFMINKEVAEDGSESGWLCRIEAIVTGSVAPLSH